METVSSKDSSTTHNVAPHTAEGTTSAGRHREHATLPSTHCASRLRHQTDARCQPDIRTGPHSQQWWITSHRTAGIRNCSGTRITGNRSAKAATTGRLRRSTAASLRGDHALDWLHSVVFISGSIPWLGSLHAQGEKELHRSCGHHEEADGVGGSILRRHKPRRPHTSRIFMSAKWKV